MFEHDEALRIMSLAQSDPEPPKLPFVSSSTRRVVCDDAPVDRVNLPKKFKTPAGVDTRPFVRWVGGKRRLLHALESCIPKAFRTYHEPFVGGGALFFHLAANGLLVRKRVVLGDINTHLMNVYRCVQQGELLQEMAGHVEVYAKGYRAVGTPGAFYTTREDFFLELRDWFNAQLRTGIAALGPSDAARFLVINRLAFNGEWRVAASGQLKSSFKDAPVDAFFVLTHLLACRVALQGGNNHGHPVELHDASFEVTLATVGEGDFVYLDPPYVELHKQWRSFPYDRSPFGLAQQIKVRDLAIALRHQGAFVVVTNADNEITRALYEGCGFRVHGVQRAGGMTDKTIGKEMIVRGEP